MQLSEVRGIYDSEGPFATVYMEGRAASEDAEHQVRLRWNDLRARLESAGAGEAVLEFLDAAVLVDDIAEVQTDGRVLVATEAGVLLNEDWDAALGAGDAAHLSDHPVLGAYVRERARSVRLLVAIADQKGATVRRIVAAEQHSLNERGNRGVDGPSSESVHKPREGALSHKQIQRRADEAVKQNIQAVADHLGRIASRWRPDVLVLAGEVQGRTALRDQLPQALKETYRETQAGGASDDGAQEALAEQLGSIAGEISTQRAQQFTEQFEHARAHHLAAEGTEAVAGAAEMGAIQTLLLNYDTPAADQEGLLAISARIDAEVGLIEAPVQDAVAAVLRFEAPDEITGETTY